LFLVFASACTTIPADQHAGIREDGIHAAEEKIVNPLKRELLSPERLQERVSARDPDLAQTHFK
jgi:hypothetical protein